GAPLAGQNFWPRAFQGFLGGSAFLGGAAGVGCSPVRAADPEPAPEAVLSPAAVLCGGDGRRRRPPVAGGGEAPAGCVALRRPAACLRAPARTGRWQE